mmetsp:Transcript_3009/g.11623  ORF Transcript_3009/g.11623 Transcript_3009/m.11623 type:complete len:517 (+) Transcript_3009:110-1660(+)
MSRMSPSLSRRSVGGAQLLLVGLVQHAASEEIFTTNAICRKSNCINPIFPGMEDLHRLEDATWQCSSLRTVSKAMKFCHGAVTYDPALPVLDVTDHDALVRKQDTAALTMFHYHLAGMGLEGWDYPDPSHADDCVKTIWKMTCYTYFPRAQLGCQEGYATTYLRPCQSSCQNYIRSCNVECCDESVKCVFKHKKKLSATLAITQTGYLPHDGPSSMCTGAAGRRFSVGSLRWVLLLVQGVHWMFSFDFAGTMPKGLRHALLVACLLGVAFMLQGCDVDVPTHNVGNWRAEPDYLISYEFVPPGGSARAAMLNSCSMPTLSQTMQCGGRGVCQLWDENNMDNPVSFCQCDRDWADPECSTHRKSQLVAFLLATFLGPFGADQFYLGFPIAGGLKMATLGGFGAWWVWDIIRTGSAPVGSQSFRVSEDLPHWVFVLSTISLALLIGFTLSYISMTKHVAERRKAALMLQSQEEYRTAGGGHEKAVSKMAGWPRGVPDYGSTNRVQGGADPNMMLRERM